jgi:DNA primase
LAFDADKAGIASAGRSANLALSMGMDVKVAKLPDGSDPADLIKEDKVKWKDAIRNSVHIIPFYIEHIRGLGYDDRKFKLAVQEKVLPFIVQIKNAIDQTHFIQLVARELGTSEEVIRSEMERSTFSFDIRKDKIVHADEKEKKDLPKRDSVEEKLAQIILWQESLENPSIDVEALKDSFVAVLGKDHFEKLLSISEDKRQQNIFKTELFYEEDQKLKEDVDELFHHLTYRLTKEELGKTMEDLRKAEISGDSDASFKLLEKSQEIANKLKKFVGK